MPRPRSSPARSSTPGGCAVELAGLAAGFARAGPVAVAALDGRGQGDPRRAVTLSGFGWACGFTRGCSSSSAPIGARRVLRGARSSFGRRAKLDPASSDIGDVDGLARSRGPGLGRRRHLRPPRRSAAWPSPSRACSSRVCSVAALVSARAGFASRDSRSAVLGWSRRPTSRSSTTPEVSGRQPGPAHAGRFAG
jgi:hypothetical protein